MPTDRQLTTLFPTVAAQWHPTKNGEGPGTIAGKAKFRAWWRCEAGHEWQEPVSQRTSTVAKWKKDDPAACAECTPDWAQNDRRQVDHTFKCGHTTRTTMGTIRDSPDKCWDCRNAEYQAEQADPAVRAAKRKAYRDKTAKLGPRPTLTVDQRQAQRRVLGLMRTSAVLDEQTLTFWRPLVSTGMEADAAEVSELLATLDVPHMVTTTGRCPSPFSQKVMRRDRVHVFRPDWPRMVELFPSLATSVREVGPEEPAPAPITLPKTKAGHVIGVYDDGEIIGQWPTPGPA